MAIKPLGRRDIRNILGNIKAFLKVPAERYWIDYDEEADVLYLSFRKPQRATDSEMLPDGVIIRKAGSRVIGLTVLNASARD